MTVKKGEGGSGEGGGGGMEEKDLDDAERLSTICLFLLLLACLLAWGWLVC